MRKSNSLFKLLGIIFLALTTFLIWKVSSFVLSAPISANANYIPPDAQWTLRMDGNAFFKESFSESFLTSGESEMVELIQELVENRTSSTETSDFGINLLSDVYVSSIRRDDKQLLVFSFNLIDSKKFERIREISKTNEIAISADKQIGVLLMPSSKNEIFSAEKLSSYAHELVTGPKSSKAITAEQSTLSSLWMNTKEYKGDLHLSIEENNVSIKGDLAISEVRNSRLKQLKPNGFHFSHAAISGQLKDTLSDILASFLPSLPSGISSISLNYRGSEITSDKNVFVLPEMDILLGYDQKVRISDFLLEQIVQGNISELTSETFKCVGKRFYYQQVDSKTIYIGREKPSYTKQNHLILVNGNPALIMKLNGDDSYLRFARLMPTFLATENLIRSVEKMDISLSTPKNGSSVVSGEIKFVDDSSPIGAILAFLVRTEMVK